MPKGSPELTEKRKNEILDACEAVYKTQGFQGVNIKEISTALDMTRSAIYHYFQTKEEILLGLLIREYEIWLAELKMFDCTINHSLDEIVENISSSLKERTIMLRILNMNLFEIEVNSRVERLAEFKKLYLEESAQLKKILLSFDDSLPDDAIDIVIQNFNAFLIGLYPFTHHTEKQLAAMELVGMELQEPSVYEAVKDYLNDVATLKKLNI